jgi:hypothetical protein
LQDISVNGRLSDTNSTENINSFLNLSNTVIGSSVTYSGGTANDIIDFGSSTVGGNVSLTLNNGFNSFNLSGGALGVIGGNVNISGGSGVDDITLDGIVGLSVSLNLGVGDNELQLSAGTVIGANLTMTSGLDDDAVILDGFIGGNVYLNLGSGDNTVDLLGTVGGSSFSYYGGLGVDSITFAVGSSTPLARVFMQLGSNDDVLNFAAADMASLYVDFGAGIDTITGILPFIPITLRNLP